MNTKIKFLFPLLLLLIFACKSDPQQSAEETVKVEIQEWKPEDTRSITGIQAERGLILNTDSATPGFILFSPAFSTSPASA